MNRSGVSSPFCRVSAEIGPPYSLFPFTRNIRNVAKAAVNSRYCPDGQITYGPTRPSPHRRHRAGPRALLDPRNPKATRWHFSEHDLPSPSDRTVRQRRHWLPALHFPRCDCRARRQVDHDHQPVTSLNTIAPDGPSGSSLHPMDRHGDSQLSILPNQLRSSPLHYTLSAASFS